MAREQTPDYESYVRQFRERQRALNKPGAVPRLPDSAMYDKSRFEFNYYATKRERAKAVANGDLAKVGNVTRSLISKQAYELSFKQSKNISNAIRTQVETGEGGNLESIIDMAVNRAIADAKAVRGKKYTEDIGKEIRARFERLTARDIRLAETDEAKRVIEELRLEYEKARKTRSGKKAGEYISETYFGS